MVYNANNWDLRSLNLLFIDLLSSDPSNPSNHGKIILWKTSLKAAKERNSGDSCLYEVVGMF